jgi:hypothetical protein
MKNLTLLFAFVFFGTLTYAQDNAKTIKSKASEEVATKQEPVKTVKKEIVNPDGTKTIVEEKVEVKKQEASEKSSTRMAINEKGVPSSSKPAKKEEKKEIKPSGMGNTITQKAEDPK